MIWPTGEQLTFSSPEDGNGGGLACKLFVVTECVTREGLTNPTYSTVFFNNMEQTPTYRFSKVRLGHGYDRPLLLSQRLRHDAWRRNLVAGGRCLPLCA